VRDLRKLGLFFREAPVDAHCGNDSNNQANDAGDRESINRAYKPCDRRVVVKRRSEKTEQEHAGEGHGPGK